MYVQTAARNRAHPGQPFHRKVSGVGLPPHVPFLLGPSQPRAPRTVSLRPVPPTACWTGRSAGKMQHLRLLGTPLGRQGAVTASCMSSSREAGRNGSTHAHVRTHVRAHPCTPSAPAALAHTEAYPTPPLLVCSVLEGPGTQEGIKIIPFDMVMHCHSQLLSIVCKIPLSDAPFRGCQDSALCPGPAGGQGSLCGAGSGLCSVRLLVKGDEVTPSEPEIFSLTSPHRFSKTFGASTGMVTPLAGLEPGAMLFTMGFGVRWTWV